MNERERLIELINFAYGLACTILADGWIRPPFKIGQKVYYISTPRRKENIFSAEVVFITYTGTGYILSLMINDNLRFEMDEEDVYATRKEAEKALKGE